MIIGFIIGIVLRLLNVLFAMMPALGNVIGNLGTALSFFIGQALPWNFLFPITDAMGLVVLVIKFEFGIAIFLFGKWVVELIRGK